MIRGSYVAQLKGANRNLEHSKEKNLKVWEIRMIEGPHTCVMPTISQDHNKMDLKLVGKNILAMVKENEQLTIPTFIAFVRQVFGYTITYRKAWLAKQWALGKVYGNWEESYNILPKYLQALQLFIPSTIVRIQTIPALDESNQPIPDKVIFHRIFWSFNPKLTLPTIFTSFLPTISAYKYHKASS